MARAMPTSSSRAAVSVGVGSPRLVRWLSVREVVKPSAPARMPSAAMAAHLGDLLGGGRLAVGAALAHHVEPHRAVAHLGGEVDVVATAVERVEVLADRLPVPGEPLVEHRAGQVLDALHQLDERLVVAGSHRREARRRSCPITTVVTPCPDDGWSRSSQVAWPS